MALKRLVLFDLIHIIITGMYQRNWHNFENDADLQAKAKLDDFAPRWKKAFEDFSPQGTGKMCG